MGLFSKSTPEKGDSVTFEHQGETKTGTVVQTHRDGKGPFYTVEWPTERPHVTGGTAIDPSQIKDVEKKRK